MRPWIVVLVSCCAGLVCAGQDFEITAIEKDGTLTWDSAYSTGDYEVEWASSPSGPWRSWQDALASLTGIESAVGPITVDVPMFYRVTWISDVTDGMVLVPGGTNAGTDPDFGPYSLTVDSFYMDRYEVTKAQWDEVRAWAVANGYGYESAASGKGADHPVHYVSWYDVVKWCNARSQREGRGPVYYTDAAFTQVYKTGQVGEPHVQSSANGYRLPTDSQWHYAARGGVVDRRFPWSDSDSIQHARANYNSSSSYSYDTSPTRGYHPDYDTDPMPYTSPVGSFAPNGYGLYDMAGNVWEWCYDWHPGHEGSSRVDRGGSWAGEAYGCRVGRRGYGAPGVAFTSGGFRAVLPPAQ